MRAVGRELGLIAVAYGCYAFVRGQVGSDGGSAYNRAVANAEQVVAFERVLGVFHEASVQRWALHFPWLVKALDTFWSYGYLVATTATLLWLLSRHIDAYRSLRTSLFVVTMVGVAIFALFPTVPPRLLPASYQILDTWSRIGGIAARNPPRIEHISDPFASMPSLHVAWACWCAIAVTTAGKHRLVKAAAWIYVVFTVVAVVATGNHFFADCVAGAALTAATVPLAPAISSRILRRPRSVLWQLESLPPPAIAIPAGIPDLAPSVVAEDRSDPDAISYSRV